MVLTKFPTISSGQGIQDILEPKKRISTTRISKEGIEYLKQQDCGLKQSNYTQSGLTMLNLTSVNCFLISWASVLLITF